jgi:hypothetical protein
MKYLALLFLICSAVGCKQSEVAVTPEQVSKQKSAPGPANDKFLDMKHLPPGAVIHTIRFKKGETLPDGRIADADVELKRVEILGKAVGGTAKQ